MDLRLQPLHRAARCLIRALVVSAMIASRGGAQQIGRDAARSDLDTLRSVIQRNSAYRLVNGFPYQRHIDSLSAALPAAQPLRQFHRSVQTIVGALQDAHSSVRLPPQAPPAVPGELPFALRTAGDTVVALAPCGCALLVPGFPRLLSINGIPLDSLLRVAGIRFAGHSPQRFRFRALGALTAIEDVLTTAGAARSGRLAVRLGGVARDTTMSMATGPRRLLPSAPLSVTAEMMGPIAVLRIPLMWGPQDAAGEVGYRMGVAAMESAAFRNARAYVIDVRNNDGGRRSFLEYLVPHFINQPLVYNVGVARVDTVELLDRGLRLPDDPALPADAQGAIRAALSRFSPRWDYRVDDFLPEVRAAVLLPVEPSRRLSDRPVVVLMDEGSFSATDLFLGAMALAPNVTLMGLPSGGGSGRSREFVLPHSGLTVVLSTMASFRPDGRLYDGYGIEPDILSPRTVQGLATGQDTQLMHALSYLRDRMAAER